MSGDISESHTMGLYFRAGGLVESGRYAIRLCLRCTLSFDHR
jgi:hypothetical protein